MNEIWKPVVGLEGLYEVSNEGVVRKSDASKHVMKPWIDKKGYIRYVLAKKNKRAHRIVLEAFIGPCPPKHEGAHLDGDPANNRLSNLAWKTSSQNKQDQIKHGTLSVCENSKLAILSNEDVTHIRRLRKAGNLWKDIHSRWPSVKMNTVIQAGTGVTFYHLSESPALRLRRSRAAWIGPKHA